MSAAGGLATDLSNGGPHTPQAVYLPSARCNVGVMYTQGDGVPKDGKEAMKWYRKAAEQGLAEAQYNLGYNYGNGIGVPKDELACITWWYIAAANGFPEAKRRMAVASFLPVYQKAEALAKEMIKKNPRLLKK